MKKLMVPPRAYITKSTGTPAPTAPLTRLLSHFWFKFPSVCVSSRRPKHSAKIMDDPKLYKANYHMQRRDVANLLKKASDSSMLRHLPNQRVLDIGCGPGDTTCSLLLPFLPDDSQVVGVDISPEMIRVARETYKSNPRIEFQECNIEGCGINIGDTLGKFDQIYSFWTFHWIQNQRVAFQNVHDLLKSDGEILFLFLATSPIYNLFETISTYPRWSKYMTDVKKMLSPFHGRTDPCAEVRHLAKTLNFQDIKCTLQNSTYEFPSMAALMKSVQAIDPFINRIPKDLKESFLSDYKAEILQGMDGLVKSSEDGEGFIVHYKTITLYASKL
nr:PREDICTED: juvenile hormone acid O-methyltransferase-like isoform X1 [Bemisia tabaci]